MHNTIKKITSFLTAVALLMGSMALLSVLPTIAAAATTSPAFSSTEAVPNSGTLGTGGNLTAYFQEANNENDLTLSGPCLINNVNVNSTFQNDTSGLYQVTYTVGATDADQAAGQIPVNCSFANTVGSTTSSTAWTDSNTTAVDTTSGSSSGGGTATTTAPTLQSAGVEPTTGMLGVGAQLQVYLQESHDMSDLTVSGSCLVNNVNVNSTFQNDTDGLYQFTYTVGATDSDQASGDVPVNCTLSDANGSITATTWTDGNTVGINASGNNNGSTGGNINGTVNSNNGVLAVTSVDQTQNTATADGTFADGWIWIFNITVPTNETSFSMKFANWTDSIDASSTIPAANNMRISSDQASSTSPVMVTGTDTFTVPMTLTSDLDSSTAGRQIQVKVEVAVPSGTENGSYGTSYGVQSTQ